MTGGEKMNKRLETILSLWREVAKKNLDIKHVTLEEVPKRQKRFENAAQNFINDPTEENFLNYWNEKNIFSAARGGAGDQVYGKWRKEDNSIEELAELIEDIKDSDSYKPEWEDKLGGRNTIREQFGLFHIEEHPPINGTTLKGLEFFGFGSESTYEAYENKVDNFKKEYLELIGYATEGTPHEVPLYMEIDKLFNVVTKIKFRDLKEIKNDTGRNLVINILVQRMLNNDLSDFLEEYSEARKSGLFDEESDHWEQWKFDHRDYFENVVEDNFSLRSLKSDKLVDLFETIEADDSLSQIIPAWLLGGQSGGIGWRDFKEKSINRSKKAATVLSQLLDKDKPLENRLNNFLEFYKSIGVL